MKTHYVEWEFVKAIEKLDNWIEIPNYEEDIFEQIEKGFQLQMKV